MRAIAYTDGRGNCDTGSCAVTMTLDSGEVIEEARFLGAVSNNVAEYEGVILAIKTAKENGITHLEINSDSKLIVYQVRGEWKIREKSLEPYRDRVWEEALPLASVKISWVRRELNSRADKLCREISKPTRTPVADRLRSRLS